MLNKWEQKEGQDRLEVYIHRVARWLLKRFTHFNLYVEDAEGAIEITEAGCLYRTELETYRQTWFVKCYYECSRES